MRITNEQIIQSARRQRETVNNRMDVAPWSRHQRPRRGFAAVIAIAASFISFIAGYGVRANISQSDIQPMAQSILVQHDTIVHTETVRDTVYQMRTVTKYVKPLTAQSSPAIDQKAINHQISENEAEQAACSMLCDNIPYVLLATP
jgi:hypothetical protein